jgi:hypothetical protein
LPCRWDTVAKQEVALKIIDLEDVYAPNLSLGISTFSLQQPSCTLKCCNRSL